MPSRDIDALRTVTQEITREQELFYLLTCINRSAAELVGASAGVVFLWEEATQELVPQAWHGHREWWKTERLRLGEGVAGMVAQHRRGMIVNDYPTSPYALSRVLERTPVSAILAEPLLYHDQLVGVIALLHEEAGRSFTPHDQVLLSLFANQAAIAIAHAHLSACLKTRMTRLQTLTQVNQLISASLDLDIVLRKIAQAAASLMQAPAVAFWLADESTQTLTFRVCSDAAIDAAPLARTLRFGQEGAGWVAQYRTLLHIPDVQSDSRIHSLSWWQTHGFTSFLGVPVLLEDTLLAVLAFAGRQPFLLSPEDRGLLDTFVSQAAIAIRNARLHTTIQNYAHQLERQIAERKGVEAALRESEHRFRQLFDEAPIGYHELDLTGRITRVNQTELAMLGYTAEEMLGKPVWSFVVDTESSRQAVQAKLRGQIPPGRAFERVYRCKDGSTITVLIEDRPLRNAQGEIIGLRSTLQDITERKHLEAQVRQLQKLEALGTLTGGIAHDFNNLLTAMLGYTELALLDLPPESHLRQALHEVLQAGQRAKKLVQQILLFSRQQDQERKPVHLHLLIKEALTLLRASLPATITIRVSLEAQEDLVLADPTQIHQVLMNLCANAEYAMRERGGELEIRLEAIEVDAAFATTHPPLQPGPHMCLTVRDTGTGIRPELLERIFDPYFTTKPVGEGTGLGLAVVHGIITGHGGAITVESTVGQGTAFHCYLPCLSQGTEEEPASELPVPGGHERILLVDDERALVLLGQEMLARLGYQVAAYASSLEALAAFRADPHRFDLVITDQTMPQMTGEALVTALRQIRPDIPIILCTGFSHTMTEEKARQLGIDAFLMKPLVLRDLGETIRRVLDGRTSAAGLFS